MRELVVVLCCVGLLACGGESPTAPSSTPTRIVSLSGNLAFGNVQVGQSKDLTFTISNSGNSTLTVSSLSITSGLTSVYTSNLANGSTIPAGGSQNVIIRFAPTAGQAYNGTITVNGDQTSGTNTISVSGTGTTGTTSPSPSPNVSSVSVTCTPETGAHQCVATARFGDNSTQVVTGQATWLSTNASVATVNSSGRVTHVSSGQTEIRATYQGVTGTLTLTITVTPSSGTSVVINEFRSRGPNGATDEFIELRNDTSSTVDISGWQVVGSNGSGNTEVRRIIDSGTTLGAGCHYLLINSNSPGYSGGVAGDTTYGVAVTDDGGIALLRANGSIVDQVGMSSGSAYREGTPLLDFGDTNSNRSYARTVNDTNNNRSDFSMTSPSTPQNRSSSCSVR